ncbi:MULTISPECIES: branched-chain amino acid ABC transporter permease [unclassified Variovorax]|uniref:branched-chain amino acid ABC transporter permease n=1 Tax=unclassified Variovorax TaxID=663243 RepID=UPI0008C6EFF0|nr:MULTISPECIES: branched-chain amino acid ABC transporter permease [unclassified Variovorax]SEK17296.1 amino acid/amide ABC transporter membrane protein 2, HAAT family [Variovorax sp. OK202]SFE78177.1 amino acid/amide ABC transporter membrane protein 2, HAAT family [Variovorax sp. OK212]
MRKPISLAALVLAVLLLPGAGWALPSSRMPIITFLCFGLAALGLTVLMRAGQVSFGHAMYAAIGGYATAFTVRAFPGADGVLAIAAGVLASLVCGALIAAFVSRYRGIFFGMLNLGLSMVLFSLAGKLYAWTGGTDGLRFERPTLLGIALERGQFELAMLLLALSLAVAVTWMVQRYFDSSSGQVLVAIRTNETRLEYIGLSARRVLAEGYVLSAGLVGLAGALLALVQSLVTPESGYWIRSGEYVFIAILGGSGHAVGAFLGAAVFELIKLAAAAYFTNAWQILLGATLIVVIFFAPQGIVGWFRRAPRTQQPQEAR